MTKDEFRSQIAEMEWRDVSYLQEKVIPLVYGMGGRFEVSEIDLHPDRGTVIVYGGYEDKAGLIRFSKKHGDQFPSVWIELFLTKLPEDVPEAFTREVGNLKEEFDIEPVNRKEGVAIGTRLSRVMNSNEIRIVYEHLQEQGQRLLPLLEGEAIQQAPTKSTPTTPIARVNGVIVN